jgi:3-deoxy-7-phosphoheptulonate synthase
MIIVMRIGSSEEEIRRVINRIEVGGLKAQISQGIVQTVIGVLGKPFPELRDALELLPGVEQVIPVSKPYKYYNRTTWDNYWWRWGSSHGWALRCRK